MLLGLIYISWKVRIHLTAKATMPALYHTAERLRPPERPQANRNAVTDFYIQCERYRARIVIRLRYSSLRSLGRSPLTAHETGFVTLAQKLDQFFPDCGTQVCPFRHDPLQRR